MRLAVSWTDPAGVSHAAGEIVDIDAITLAQLEEGGVVDDIKEPEGTTTEDGWIGPGEPPPDEEPQQADWIGPGGPPA